jgi:hypothetical protein
MEEALPEEVARVHAASWACPHPNRMSVHDGRDSPGAGGEPHGDADAVTAETLNVTRLPEVRSPRKPEFLRRSRGGRARDSAAEHRQNDQAQYTKSTTGTSTEVPGVRPTGWASARDRPSTALG